MEEKEQSIEKTSVSSYAIDVAREYYRGEDGISLTERKAMENDGTMVTVVCITYKHEEFIAQALDSFLMQKTNFKYKIFVGEDCGPDGTADIIREYAKKYPDIIVPFLREKNMGAQRNLIDLCQRATSPYIAFCEGDDYWIDENKLQKQVEYMNAHREMRFCFHNIEIVAPDDWYLNSYYKPTPDGKRLMPACIPGYNNNQKVFDAQSYIKHNPARTSSIFYRWNYDLPIPDWYYTHLGGDVSLAMMQLGTGKCGIIDGTMATWRRSEVGVTFAKDMNTDFLKTRIDWVGILADLRQYFIEHHNGFAKVGIENRLKLESANYLRTLLKMKSYDKISDFFSLFPEASAVALNAYLTFYDDSRSLTSSIGWDGYQLVVRNWRFRKILTPLVGWTQKAQKWYTRFYKNPKDKLRGRIQNFMSFLYYWKNTLIPKNPNIWVFSGYNMNNYMDNSKYLYEYVLEHHPEIKAVWVTKDLKVLNQLTAENKPVVMWRTDECRRIVSQAQIAVIDHFKMSDTDNLSGYNDKTKIVQLWHGVGLKSMQDVVDATTVDGVRYDHSMVLTEKDKGWQRFKKKLWHFRHAYFSERFEHYFMLLCPGQERIDQIAKTMKIPLDRCFISGHPRNIYLHSLDSKTNRIKILYAPTFRWNSKAEENMCIQILEDAEKIERFLAENDYELTIRLHPLTWRNYSRQLGQLDDSCEHIVIDREKDVYQTLGTYDILITDYSSIAYDFVLLDRPVIFFNFDYDEYRQHDHSLNYDYETYSPGTKTSTWEETLEAIAEYAENPQKDSQWRCRVRDEFYDMSANDEHNSERIIQEIKRRLNESK